jgi:hypothetical protein
MLRTLQAETQPVILVQSCLLARSEAANRVFIWHLLSANIALGNAASQLEG